MRPKDLSSSIIVGKNLVNKTFDHINQLRMSKGQSEVVSIITFVDFFIPYFCIRSTKIFENIVHKKGRLIFLLC